MRRIALMFVLALTTSLLAQDNPTTKPATQPSDVTLKVVSVRVNRSSQELQKKFRNRYSGDGSPGVSMQLLLSVTGQQLLPVTRDAVSIDTFVDDTYQNLLSGQRDYSGSNYVQVSDDGTMLLFPVNANKAPAEDAERVFVRGTIAARVARGEAKTISARTKLKVGEPFTAGPFKGSIRSVSESGQNNISASVSLTGEGGSIRNVKVLSNTGTTLQERIDPRNDGYSEQRGTVFNVLIPSGNEDITLEFTHYEKLDNVKIPFEVQFDLGQAKAGPIEAGPAPKADRRRPWPPPPTEERVEFQARRPGFRPGSATQPAEKPKLEKVGVDIFSLTVGKPSPEELPTAQWQNPPSMNFRPRGFTLARLMLSVPDATILAVLPQDMNLLSFSDDKTARIDAGLSPSFISGYGARANTATVSPDGQQALVTLPIDAPVTPGATRVSLAGSMKAVVGRQEKVVTSQPLEIKGGESFSAGPFQITLRDVRQQPPMSIDYASDPTYQVQVQIKGPLKQFRRLEISGARNMGGYPSSLHMNPEAAEMTETTMQLMLPQMPEGKQPITVRYFESVDTVTLPFEISTPLGL